MSELAVDAPQPNLTKKDFTSDQMVRWCPGCGDYAILSSIQNTLPQIPEKKEDFRIYFRYWMCSALSILYEYLWFSYYSWQSPSCRHWSEACQPKVERMANYR